MSKIDMRAVTLGSSIIKAGAPFASQDLELAHKLAFRIKGDVFPLLTDILSTR
jgi:hypothetical protein